MAATYCKRCKKKVPAKRMRALPETELCVGCSEAVDGDFKYVTTCARTSKEGSMKINYGDVTRQRYRKEIEPLS